MIEIWKPVKGFENYEVSNLGQVKSLNYNRTKEAKILRLCKNKDGYLTVTLYKNGKGYAKKVHRLVTAAFIPNPEGKTEVNHIDGNKTNNRVENLEWATHSENMHHAWETGLCEPLTGENHPMYGKHHTEETRKKLSKALTGENHPMYGKQLSEEHKKKLSESHKGKYTGKYTGKKNPRARKVICITTGETFNCILEAEEKYNIVHQSISKCCKGKYKSAGKLPTGEKLVWRYAEDLKEKIK